MARFILITFLCMPLFILGQNDTYLKSFGAYHLPSEKGFQKDSFVPLNKLEHAIETTLIYDVKANQFLGNSFLTKPYFLSHVLQNNIAYEFIKESQMDKLIKLKSQNNSKWQFRNAIDLDDLLEN